MTDADELHRECMTSARIASVKGLGFAVRGTARSND